MLWNARGDHAQDGVGGSLTPSVNRLDEFSARARFETDVDTFSPTNQNDVQNPESNAWAQRVM